ADASNFVGAALRGRPYADKSAQEILITGRPRRAAPTKFEIMTAHSKKIIWNAQIVKRAIVDSFKKLNPRKMMGNPVMFVVEVGSVLTTLQLIRGIVAPIRGVTNTGFELQITLWLWFTVLFANFAEAMAEGRGKAQADNLRKAKTETIAHRVMTGDKVEDVAAA